MLKSKVENLKIQLAGIYQKISGNLQAHLQDSSVDPLDLDEILSVIKLYNGGQDFVVSEETMKIKKQQAEWRAEAVSIRILSNLKFNTNLETISSDYLKGLSYANFAGMADKYNQELLQKLEGMIANLKKHNNNEAKLKRDYSGAFELLNTLKPA